MGLVEAARTAARYSLAVMVERGFGSCVYIAGKGGSV